jgi:hypothetical protein
MENKLSKKQAAHNPEDGGSMSLRSIIEHLPDYMIATTMDTSITSK